MPGCEGRRLGICSTLPFVPDVRLYFVQVHYPECFGYGEALLYDTSDLSLSSLGMCILWVPESSYIYIFRIRFGSTPYPIITVADPPCY